MEAAELGTAAAVYIRSMGPGRVYCAKVFHDLTAPCPFRCRFEELMANAGEPTAERK